MSSFGPTIIEYDHFLLQELQSLSPRHSDLAIRFNAVMELDEAAGWAIKMSRGSTYESSSLANKAKTIALLRAARAEVQNALNCV